MEPLSGASRRSTAGIVQPMPLLSRSDSVFHNRPISSILQILYAEEPFRFWKLLQKEETREDIQRIYHTLEMEFFSLSLLLTTVCTRSGAGQEL
jgi:hypothetical protein